MGNGNALDEMTQGSKGVAGGVQDVYGEDSATEAQHITPWTVSVAR